MADENTTKSGLQSAEPTDLTSIRIKLEKQMAEYAAGDICLAFSGGVDSSLLLKGRGPGRGAYGQAGLGR